MALGTRKEYWKVLNKYTLLLFLPPLRCRHDTQHNDIQRNDTQHNDTQRNDTQHNDTQNNDIQRNDTQHNDIQQNNK